MDETSQIRNFKDFLQLYNKITELCFSSCVDNFYNRKLSLNEGACVDQCVSKFTNVNQKIMNVYVEVQTEINIRRVAEMEANEKLIQSKKLAAENQTVESTAKLDSNTVVTT